MLYHNLNFICEDILFERMIKFTIIFLVTGLPNYQLLHLRKYDIHTK